VWSSWTKTTPHLHQEYSSRYLSIYTFLP
jgi:hypothetical protein